MIKKVIQNVIFIFLVIILGLVCYSKYIKKDEIVKIGGYSVLIVLTESMEPTIYPQELILIKECDNYELNDIVTYRSADETLITHRILQIDEYSFMAKGDKNKVADASMVLETIQGKVIFHSKLLGIFVVYYLKKIMILYFIILVIIYLRKLIKENKNEKEK